MNWDCAALGSLSANSSRFSLTSVGISWVFVLIVRCFVGFYCVWEDAKALFPVFLQALRALCQIRFRCLNEKIPMAAAKQSAPDESSGIDWTT